MTSLVDSNLLLRRVQLTHPMFAAADRAIRQLTQRGEIIHICSQNHAEFWAVATRPVTANGLGMTPTQADAELSRMEFLFPLLPDTPAVLPAFSPPPQVYGIGQLLTFNTQDFTCYAVLAPTVQIVDPQTV